MILGIAVNVDLDCTRVTRFFHINLMDERKTVGPDRIPNKAAFQMTCPFV